MVGEDRGYGEGREDAAATVQLLEEAGEAVVVGLDGCAHSGVVVAVGLNHAIAGEINFEILEACGLQRSRLAGEALEGGRVSGVEAESAVVLIGFALHLGTGIAARVGATLEERAVEVALVPPEAERRDVSARHLPVAFCMEAEFTFLPGIEVVPGIDAEDLRSVGRAVAGRTERLGHVVADVEVGLEAVLLGQHAPALPAEGGAVRPVLATWLHAVAGAGKLFHGLAPVGACRDEEASAADLLADERAMGQDVVGLRRGNAREGGDASALQSNSALPMVVVDGADGHAFASKRTEEGRHLIAGAYGVEGQQMVAHEAVVVIGHLEEANGGIAHVRTFIICACALLSDGSQVVALERAAIDHGEGELRDDGIGEDADEECHLPAAVGEGKTADAPSSESGMLHAHRPLVDLGQVGSRDDLCAEAGFGHEIREQRLTALQEGEGVCTLVEADGVSV